MKKALLIIANEGFQDTEFGVPKALLEEAGVEITIAAGRKGTCTGKFGATAGATHTLEEVSGDAYDAVVFIGGPGASQYEGNMEYLRLAKEANLLAAICIAPSLLAPAGVFRGKRATGWDSGGVQQQIIENSGGTFTGEPVTIDGNVITGNGPEAAEAFGREILKALAA